MGRGSSARYAQLREQCAARGLRLTPQRDVLLRTLGETRGHPTAHDLVKLAGFRIDRRDVQLHGCGNGCR